MRMVEKFSESHINKIMFSYNIHKMSYHKVHLNLDKPKMVKLAQGAQIRLEPRHMTNGKHEVHLTKTQIGHLSKAKSERKGAMIRMSNAQLRHNKLRGSGAFSNLLKSAGSAIIKSGLVQKGANYALGKAADFAKSKGINADVVDTLHGLASKGVNAGINKIDQHLSGGDLSGIPIIGPILHGLFGLGLSKSRAIAVVKRAHRAHKMKGGSFKMHVKREAKKELAKKKKRPAKKRTTRKRRTGGSFLL